MKYPLNLFFMTLMVAQTAFGDVWITPSELVPKSKNDTLMQKQREEFHDSDFESYYDLQLAHPITSKALTDFLDLETQAQRAEVNGEFLDSLEKYNHLISSLFEVPNVSGVQKITFSALVQRAHLADILKLATSERYWNEAHAFFPTADFSKNEFAPDLAKKFNKLKRAAGFELILAVNPFASVYVDGRSVKNTDGSIHFSLELGVHQACALTPGAEWSCKKFEFYGPANYVKLNLESSAIAAGTCEEPEYHGQPLPKHVKLIVNFAANQCQRVYFDRTWFSVTGQRLESLGQTPTASLIERASVAEPLKKNWIQDLTKSGWFWSGVGVAIVGAIMISGQNQQQTVVVPSQSYH